MKRRFPRSRLQKIIKSYQKEIKMTKNVDILIFLNYMMFLRSLAIEANLNCQESGQKHLTGTHVENALPVVLKKFRG
ncbi:inner kinetochore subunit wip1-like [Xenia sp. Carnegie-2017]|uniref:inner kinetochore subunit wip1-like n=1 Tax=Xenia sp. Carnegie-2017 TaxID=2897299 RepID=UPI001F050430|nr:inner kinetochore subunit wip1-like [Xenia sp. Carnegie-2017]